MGRISWPPTAAGEELLAAVNAAKSLNEAIFDLVDEINARPFQKREDSRRIVFERDECRRP